MPESSYIEFLQVGGKLGAGWGRKVEDRERGYSSRLLSFK